MLKKTTLALMTCLAFTACTSSTPRVIQATTDMPAIHLTSGMATQIELPNGHVQSVVTGNPSLVTAERVDNIVNLIPKEGTGETNLIVRSTDEDGDAKLYQYRVIVEGR